MNFCVKFFTKENKINTKLFKSSEEFVRLCEISLSGTKYVNKKGISKFYSFEFDNRLPMGYILKGASDFFSPYLKVLYSLVILLLLLISYIYLIGDISIQVGIYLVMIFLIPIAFALPSRYAFYKVTTEDIEKIILLFKLLDISNENELDLLRANVSIIYQRVKERVNAFRWIIGISWSLFIFFKDLFMEIYPLLKFDISNQLGEILNLIIVISIYFLLPIILVSIYKKGMDYLFKTIEFAINEQKLIFNLNKKEIS